jgi:hypothetical protein
MKRKNNELSTGKQSLPVLPTLSFLEAGLWSETDQMVMPAVCRWQFESENFFVILAITT